MNKPDINNLHRAQLSEKYFRNSYPEYTEYLNKSFPNLSWQDKLYCDQYGLSEPPKCPICGKNIPLISLFKGYRQYCSNKCATADPARIKKIQQTNTERYGVAHALQSDKIRKKFQQTCIDRFGATNPTKNKNIAAKAQATILKRYGAFGSASPELCRRAVLSRRNARLKQSSIPNQVGYTDDGQWIIKCTKDVPCTGCDGTFSIHSTNYFDRTKLNLELCTKINPIDPKKIKNTRIEKFVQNILDQHNIPYQTNVRNIISPKEVDIFIPSHNIAIECNGVYWHSMKPQKYHLEKFEACESVGTQLLTIWEDWVTNKPEQTKSLILSKLGIYKRRIGASRCKIKEIPSKQAQQFFEQNHIQGRCKSIVRVGLYYKDELVGVMAFNKRSSWAKEDCWELIRFCTLCHTQVIGGADRLLKYFISHIKPVKIVSFSSNDISTGALYKRLNFQRFSRSLAYWYIGQDDLRRYHRTSFCKTRLATMGFDTSTQTEREIMEQLPYWRIYDSGTTGWELPLK